MKETKCEKCGCESVFVKPSGRRFGVFCKDCGAVIKWISYDETKESIRNNTNDSIGERYSIRKIKKKNRITRIRCSKCDTLLYNSSFPKVQGQFDLVNAKFCPWCGRELI